MIWFTFRGIFDVTPYEPSSDWWMMAGYPDPSDPVAVAEWEAANPHLVDAYIKNSEIVVNSETWIKCKEQLSGEDCRFETGGGLSIN